MTHHLVYLNERVFKCKTAVFTKPRAAEPGGGDVLFLLTYLCCGIWVKLCDTITPCVTLKVCVTSSESLVVNCASFIVFCQQDLVLQVLLPLRRLYTSVCVCVCVTGCMHEYVQTCWTCVFSCIHHACV